MLISISVTVHDLHMIHVTINPGSTLSSSPTAQVSHLRQTPPVQVDHHSPSTHPTCTLRTCVSSSMCVISVLTPCLQGPHTLPLVVASFSLNGSFLGLHNVSDQLMICRDLPPRYQAAWRVGVQYKVDCLVGVASLSKASSDPIFYDLCILSRVKPLIIPSMVYA